MSHESAQVVVLQAEIREEPYMSPTHSARAVRSRRLILPVLCVIAVAHVTMPAPALASTQCCPPVEDYCPPEAKSAPVVLIELEDPSGMTDSNSWPVSCRPAEVDEWRVAELHAVDMQGELTNAIAGTAAAGTAVQVGDKFAPAKQIQWAWDITPGNCRVLVSWQGGTAVPHPIGWFEPHGTLRPLGGCLGWADPDKVMKDLFLPRSDCVFYLTGRSHGCPDDAGDGLTGDGCAAGRARAGNRPDPGLLVLLTLALAVPFLRRRKLVAIEPIGRP